ncbi:MAG: hypothetical protein KGI37_06445 [Alphaproteobacteria bacterium]|nr:hypothetical protein [Alphaproteobacteria bacterium]
MAKAKLKIESLPINSILKRRTHSIHPWEVQHHPDHSEIEAYIEITGEWEIIAVIKSINHVAIADFLVALANEHNQKR